MNTIKGLALACFLPLLVACSDQGVDQDGIPLGWGPRQAEMCVRAGGYESMAFTEFCQFNTADTGQICRDTSECEGECLAVPLGRDAEAPSVGTPASGQCSNVRHVMGCQTWVVNGRVEETICIN